MNNQHPYAFCHIVWRHNFAHKCVALYLVFFILIWSHFQMCDFTQFANFTPPGLQTKFQDWDSVVAANWTPAFWIMLASSWQWLVNDSFHDVGPTPLARRCSTFHFDIGQPIANSRRNVSPMLGQLCSARRVEQWFLTWGPGTPWGSQTQIWNINKFSPI